MEVVSKAVRQNGLATPALIQGLGSISRAPRNCIGFVSKVLGEFVRGFAQVLVRFWVS